MLVISCKENKKEQDNFKTEISKSNFKKEDGRKWIIIGRKRVDRNNSSGLTFTVPNNAIRVGLTLENISGIYLASMQTSQPDEYGTNSWDIHRDFGVKYVSTGFHEGTYTIFGSTGGRRIVQPNWKYDLKVTCLVEE